MNPPAQRRQQRHDVVALRLSRPPRAPTSRHQLCCSLTRMQRTTHLQHEQQRHHQVEHATPQPRPEARTSRGRRRTPARSSPTGTGPRTAAAPPRRGTLPFSARAAPTVVVAHRLHRRLERPFLLLPPPAAAATRAPPRCVPRAAACRGGRRRGCSRPCPSWEVIVPIMPSSTNCWHSIEYTCDSMITFG